MKLKSKELVTFGIFAALMYVSQLALSFLPNIHLTGVFIIVLSVMWRWKALYPVMAYILINGIFCGFATWWLPYIYIWPMLVAATSIFMKREFIRTVLNMGKYECKHIELKLACINAAHGFLFGTMYALAYAPIMGMNFQETITWIIAGLPYDAIHGCSNFILGLALIGRLADITIKFTKYGQN